MPKCQKVPKRQKLHFFEFLNFLEKIQKFKKVQIHQKDTAKGPRTRGSRGRSPRWGVLGAKPPDLIIKERGQGAEPLARCRASSPAGLLRAKPLSIHIIDRKCSLRLRIKTSGWHYVYHEKLRWVRTDYSGYTRALPLTTHQGYSPWT